jgi:hypothetical protein
MIMDLSIQSRYNNLLKRLFDSDLIQSVVIIMYFILYIYQFKNNIYY